MTAKELKIPAEGKMERWKNLPSKSKIGTMNAKGEFIEYWQLGEFMLSNFIYLDMHI